MFEELFLQIGVIFVAAAGLSLLTYAIKQPLIIAYILTGLLLGPGVLDFAHNGEILAVLSEIGIAFLLFLVGINLNWRHVKEVGSVSLTAGLGQALLTSGVGFVLVRALGYTAIESLFLSIAFAFSSTIIVVKLLSDKEDLERLYGRIAVGVLIVQDLIAMVLLLVVGALRDNTGLAELLTVSLVKGAVVIAVLWLISHLILPRIVRYAARSQELLFLFALGWCFVIAGALHALGFGIEIGALLAGISLAGTGFSGEVESKIRPLRDFFLVVFFIVLGMNLTFASLGSALVPSIILSLFVLIGNPLIVILLLRLLGYHPRTGFLTGTTVAQISEFSFIVLGGGIAAGLIDTSILPMATIVGLVTIAVSSYLITYNGQVYEALEPFFAWMAPKNAKGKEVKHAPVDVLMLGVRDMGETLLPAVKDLGKSYKMVDFDPQIIERFKENGEPVVYGDAGNEALLSKVYAHKTKLIISTIPDIHVSGDVLRFLKKRRYRGTVILTAKTKLDADKLYEQGATFVVIPTVLGGTHLIELLEKKRTLKRSWTAAGKKRKR